MYSWSGQLYTALRTGCQGIKGPSAGLAGFSGIKNAYRGRKKLLDNGAFFCPRIIGKFFLPTNCTNGHEWLQWIKMATGSVALIYTNARRGMSCGVVPSRHIVLGSPIRALRTRLPKSYAFVVPSRHLTPKSINALVIKTTTRTTGDNLQLSLASATGK